MSQLHFYYFKISLRYWHSWLVKFFNFYKDLENVAMPRYSEDYVEGHPFTGIILYDMQICIEFIENYKVAYS